MRIFSKRKLLWYPLDNAAKIYPPTASAKRPHVFSFSAFLDKEINSNFLQEAATNVLSHYPTFKTTLKKGAFWYYLEENLQPVKVFGEKPYYLKPIDYQENNGYLFQVFYIRNKITINFFHALTDGTGGFQFFTEVVADYIRICGDNIDLEGKIHPVDEPINISSTEDSFIEYNPKSKTKAEKIPRPYAIKGTPFDYDGNGMITAVFDMEQVKVLAKECNVSITAYLAAVYSKAIFEACLKGKHINNKLVTVLVPCNLRKKYGGETVRNFTMFARVTIDWSDENRTVEDCAKIAAVQIEDGLKKEKLDKIIYDNVKLEKNIFIKLTPLFLKNLIMRLVYVNVGENLQTVNFSNIGLANVPDAFKNHVKGMTFSIAPTFSCGHQTGVVGYNGKLFVTFSRNYVETGIERAFVRCLTEKGVDVTISSNYWESKP